MENLEPAFAYMRTHGIQGSINTALLVARALQHGVEIAPIGTRRVRLRMRDTAITYQGGWVSLNSKLATRCTRDKLVTSQLLRSRGVPAPQNASFEPTDVRRAWRWAKPILPVVVKPSNANKGRGVHVNIASRRDFEQAFRTVAADFGAVLVEAFVHGTEHRVVIIRGRVAAATRRMPANVLGDGRSTVAELVEAKNELRRSRGIPDLWDLRIDSISQAELGRQGLSVSSVPALGQVVYIRATSNLSTGGDAIDATDELEPDVIELAQRATKALPGLIVAGLDIVLPREPHAQEATVLEINPSPGLAMHHFPWIGEARDITSELLYTMFPTLRKDLAREQS